MFNRLLSSLVRFPQRIFLMTFLIFMTPLSLAEITEASLEADVNSLSAEVDVLAKDIAQLERDLLFPPLTRLQVYVSLAADVQFTPHSMVLFIDAEEKSFHIYSESDVAALRLGGLQRLWEGNIAMGKHQIAALIKGVDKKDRAVEEKVEFNFNKKNSGHSLEIRMTAEKNSKKPSFSVKDWGEI